MAGGSGRKGGSTRLPQPRFRLLRVLLAGFVFAAIGLLLYQLASAWLGRNAGEWVLAELNARLESGRIEAAGSRVRLQPWAWRLDLELSGLRLRAPDDSVLAAAATAAAAIDLEGLTGWRISPEQVTITGLAVDPDWLSTSEGDDGGAGLVLAAWLAAAELASPPRIEIRDAWLGPAGGAGAATWRFDAIRITAGQGAAGPFAELSAALHPDRAGQLRLRAELDAAGTAAVTAEFSSLPAGDVLAVLAPRLPDSLTDTLADADRLAGSARFDLAGDFAGDLALGAAEGRLEILPANAADTGFRRAELDFRLDPAAARITLPRIGVELAAGRFAGEAALELAGDGITRAVGSLEGALAALGAASLAFDFRPAEGRLDLTDLRLAPASAEADDTAVLTGSVSLREIRAAAGGVAGRLESGAGTLSLPAAGATPHRVAFTDLATEFHYRRGDGFRTTGPATLRIGGVDLELAPLTLQPGDPEFALRLRGGPMDAASVARLWPAELAGRFRDWFTTRVEAGEFHLDLAVDGPHAAPRTRLAFTFAGVAAAPGDGQPLISDASGAGEASGDGFRLRLDGAGIEAGGQALRLTAGSLDIADPAATPLELRLQGEGEAGLAALAALAGPALSLPPALGRHLQGASGVVQLAGEARLAVPAGDAPPAWQVTASGSGLAVADPAAGPVLRDGRLEARLTGEELAASGGGEVFGHRMTFRAAGSEAGLDIAGEVAAAALLPERLFADSLDYRLQLAADSADWELALDLAPARLQVGETVVKPAGAPGQLVVRGPDAEPEAGPGISLRLPGLDLEGRFRAGEAGWHLPLAGSITSDLLDRFGLPVVGPAASLTADLQGAGAELQDLVLRIDLEAMAPVGITPELVALGIDPRPGAGAHLAVTADLGGAGSARLSGTYGGLRFSGEPVATPDGAHWRANLEIGSASRFTVDVQSEATGRYRVDLVGDALDLRGASVAATDATATPGPAPEVELALRLRRLTITDDIWLRDAAGRVVLLADSSLNGQVTGRALGSVPAEMRISGRLEGPVDLALTAEDAGEVFNALGITVGAAGGVLQLTSLPVDDPADPPAHRVTASGMRIGGVPLLARLMSFVSGIGLIEYVLTGETLIDTAMVDVVSEGDLLRLRRGSIESASLNFLFAGSYDRARDELDIYGIGSPLGIVDRLLRDLPIIGEVVRGPGGAGIVGAGFHITGSADDPQVESSPLDLLLPLLPQLGYQERQAEAEAEGAR